MENHIVTRLLYAVRTGSKGAAEELWKAVYQQLYVMAAARMAEERGPRTLQPTALVNEAYLRLFGGNDHFENRRHFFSAAARAMHQILVDDARRRGRLKRGGAATTQSSALAADGQGDDMPGTGDLDPAEVLAIDEALARLGQEQPDLVEVVRLRYFVGMTLDETAEALAVSRRTVATRWRLARAWLHEALAGIARPDSY